MKNKIIEEIRKTNPDCIIEKTLDERVEEIKKKCGVETIEEMEVLVERTINQNQK